MALLDPIVFEVPVKSDYEINRLEGFKLAEPIYNELRANPDNWAKFAEVTLIQDEDGTEIVSHEDYIVQFVNNALNGCSDILGFTGRTFRRCETKIKYVGDKKIYYAKYRRMFH